MKYMLKAVVLLACIVPIVAVPGCTKQQPPAWAITAPERTVGDIIAAGNAAVVKYEADVKAGVAGTDNATLKAVMSDIQKALVIAQPAYVTWANALKANPAAQESADLAGAIAAIQNALNALPSTYSK